SGTYCVQGTAYWTDSCGNPNEVQQHCQCGCTPDHTACETCQECIPQTQTFCQAGTVYWGDSCDALGAVKETCECGCSQDGLGCNPDCGCQPDCEGKACGLDGCGGLCPPGCGDTERCDDGTCIEVRAVGDPCTQDAQCGENGRCLTEGFPGGLCLTTGCSDSNPCPSGSGCYSFTDGSTACIKKCNQDSNCREAEGYICDSYNTCWPACQSDDDCPTDWICDTNTGECVEVGPDCSPENPSGYCPPGQVCTDGACEEFVCDDTLLEPNESQEDALPLPAADTSGFQICSGDRDWYTVTPDQNNIYYTVGIDSAHSNGDLEVDLTEEDGGIRASASIEPDSYHSENSVGPLNLQAYGLVGAPNSQPTWLEIKGKNGAVNNYSVVNRQVEWQDGSDCIELFGAQDCLATSTSGRHDSSKLLVFPIGHPADPYIGDGVFFENGLWYVGGPQFTVTSSMWGRRNILMIIRHAIHSVQEAFPGTAPLGIGDIGMPDGTTPSGHPNGTHYYGTNIDVAYFIKPEFQGEYGNMCYRHICCDAAMNDWNCVVHSNTRSPDYGTCIPGSESTHIVDIPRTAMFIAKVAGSGHLRVIGVEAKIEAELDSALTDLVSQGLITAAEKSAALARMATANDHGSWIWHFNHMHASFEISGSRRSAAFQGPWLDGTPEEQEERARAFCPLVPLP
ncbi:hypothetical protein ACFL2F_04695, partial [Myxococcota bacterium]